MRVPVTAGPHDVAVTFFRVPPDLVEQVREPFENPAAPSGTGGITGRLPSISTVTIVGPHGAKGPGDTPSRRRIFSCTPASASQEAACARTILTTLTRRAYRGLSTREQVDELMTFFEAGKGEHGKFDDGIELALRRLLVSPEFLYRIEGDADGRSADLQLRCRAGSSRTASLRCPPLDESRARLPIVVLPLEQHPRRCAARPGRSRDAGHARGARRAGAAHARRSPRRDADHQLRVAVAADSQPGDGAAWRELRAQLGRDAAPAA